MDKGKKNRIKRYLTWAGIAALVALLAVMPLLARREAAADGPVASVLSAKVTRGEIPLVLRGGGTLESKGQQDVNIPTGVKITEFLVKNGDTVKEGDPVARVDKVSVMEAITQVAETMDFLREELEDGREEKVDSQVVATAGGRVKEIFAWEGESVQDVMLRRGALALLSIDGLMAVRLEVAAPVTTGESVSVTIHGKEVDGRVESNLSGVLIVTLEDEGYDIGETVEVRLEDGTSLGEGELYVHNAWKAIAYSGTVSTVNIRKEQVLSSGTTLFTLKDTAYEGQLRHRASQHREYEALLQRLLSMYESGWIAAPCGGVVSGVDEDSAHLLAAENFEAELTLLGGGVEDWGNVQLMLLSSVTCKGADPNVTDCQAASHIAGCPKFCDGKASCKAPVHNEDCLARCTEDKTCPATKHKTNCIKRCDKAATANDPCDATKHYEECIKSCLTEKTEGVCKNKKYPHYLACIESCASAKTEKDSCEATGLHRNSCIRSCIRADEPGKCKPGVKDAPHYGDCIESCTGQKDCPASKHLSTCYQYGMTYTATVAKVDSVGATELVVFWDASGAQYPVVKTGSGWAIVGGQFNEALLVVGGTLATGNAQSFKKGDIILCITGTKGGNVEYQDVVFYKASAAGGMPGFGGMNFNFDISGMMGGFAGYGSASAMPQESENLYDLDGSTLLTVTPEEGIEVEILLDERDIAKVQEGMEATIKVEALRGKSFSGTVARVGAIGAHSGSTGKFTVRVETDSIPDSLPGMSSTVTIHREIHEDVLTLPVAALNQDGAKTFVYTALDKKTGQPASPREITTGASDGETVEVFGLEEGTQVYYLYYDVLEIDHTARERQFNLN